MSKLYVSDPTHSPEKMLTDMGVWTPAQYRKMLQQFNLDKNDVEARMAAFQCRFDNAKAYCKGLLEFELSGEVENALWNARSSKQRSRSSIRRQRAGGIGEDYKVELDPKHYDDSSDDIVEKCRNVELFDINGQKLEGRDLAQCLFAHRAKQSFARTYHTSMLNARKSCKEENKNDTRYNIGGQQRDTPELSRCVTRKMKSATAQFILAKDIMDGIEGAMANWAQERVNTSTPEEQSRWRTMLSSLWRVINTVFKGVVSPILSLGFWMVRDPATAQIVLFISRGVIRGICQKVHVKLLGMKYERSLMEKVGSAVGVGSAQEAGDIAKIGLQQAIGQWFSGGGFDTAWNSMSTIVGKGLQKAVSNVPIAGGFISGIMEGIGDIAKESARFGAELALYKTRIEGSQIILIDIIYDIIPTSSSGCWSPFFASPSSEQTGGGYRYHQRGGMSDAEIIGEIKGLRDTFKKEPDSLPPFLKDAFTPSGEFRQNLGLDTMVKPRQEEEEEMVFDDAQSYQDEWPEDEDEFYSAEDGDSPPPAVVGNTEFKFVLPEFGKPPPPQSSPSKGFHFDPPSFGGGYRRRRHIALPPSY